MKEEWKDIPEFEGFYQVSNFGNVKNIKTNHILKGGDNGRGYRFIFLCYNKKKRFYIHRLVATAFIDNPNNYPEVNHIDGDKNNNRVDNLEWCSSLMNSLHKRYVLEKTNCKAVKCIETNRVFNSITEASKLYNLQRTKIGQVANKRKGRKTCGGFHWVYVEK